MGTIARMDSARWRQIAKIFQLAIAREGDSRNTYLDDACREDPSLRAEVDRLIDAHLTADARTSPGVGVPLDLSANNARLRAGSTFGQYVIAGRIGVGGMGEVYQARDPRLGRDVALKVLPEAFAFDAERRSRFQREARLLASLNHPHIAVIHGLEESSGQMALVLELVEGPTLAERLRRGPIPLTEAVTLATQIAGALDAAHASGVIHRDLKPGNIKLAPGRGVKVLDFGLAKALGTFGSGTEPLPTVTSDGTQQGTILGTPAYMSPEQARGQPLDKRTDIWAFGCVLYEMLTGRLAFQGKTTSDTIVSILEREPDWRALPAATPAGTRRVLRRSLEKDPRRRLRDIGDASIELVAVAGEEESPTPTVPIRRRFPAWALAVSALTLIAATAGITSLAVKRAEAPPPSPSTVVRFSIPPPPGNSFGGSLADVETTYLGLSPNGTQLAFIATDQKTRISRVWIRWLGSLEAQPVAGTEGANSLFWSPDGRSIAFFTQEHLKRLDLPDGRPVNLAPVPSGVGLAGTWAPGGRILLASVQNRQILEISTTGGSPTPIVNAEEGRETRFWWPQFLPDDRFIYLAGRPDGTGELKLAGSSTGSPPRSLMSLNSNVAWVDPDYIVFGRDGSLLAQRFDLTQERFVGEPHAIADTVNYAYLPPRTVFSASRSGTVVYQTHRDTSRLAWIDRTGKELGTIGDQPSYLNLRMSPERDRIMTAASDPRLGTPDLWVFDVRRGNETRLTSGPRPEVTGTWAPGLDSIVYSIARGGPPTLIQRNLSTGAERDLLPSPDFQVAADFTPDGKQLIFMQRSSRGIWELFTTTVDVQPKVSPLQPSPFSQVGPRLSRDGRAIAFLAADSGKYELYLAPFPTGAKIRITTGGAQLPRWSPDGQKLYYLSADGRLMEVPIRTTPSLDVGTPRALFSLTRLWLDFDVSADGSRFVAIVPQILSREQPVTVVLNWQGELRR